MLSIHYYKAIGHYCLYFVTDTEYKIVRVFSYRLSARLFGFFYGLKVNEL